MLIYKFWNFNVHLKTFFNKFAEEMDIFTSLSFQIHFYNPRPETGRKFCTYEKRHHSMMIILFLAATFDKKV